ncbi:MAG: PTS sugar transporter subunit IIA [Candidatus Eisenbacteria bacterium]|uniref:PTS sugar transporter subunit IIA n=1 Tax=Eiseniibacteriota bacterium TaxID=2212470 RepID=A0A938BQR1_UNCEI|nr:PTS sugar transporter subunit IIA [Candidatus Eisenbacteria bacterium]
MTLTDLLTADCIQLDAPALHKEELIGVLVDCFARAGSARASAPVVRALLDREAVMSTGIGGGIALPHAQSPAVEGLTVAFARPKEPIEFAALDGNPVSLVFLVVGSGDRTGLMRVLTHISRILHSGELKKKLLKARSPEEVLRAIRGEEGRLKLETT